MPSSVDGVGPFGVKVARGVSVGRGVVLSRNTADGLGARVAVFGARGVRVTARRVGVKLGEGKFSGVSVAVGDSTARAMRGVIWCTVSASDEANGCHVNTKSAMDAHKPNSKMNNRT